jgi:hypothetical protein
MKKLPKFDLINSKLLQMKTSNLFTVLIIVSLSLLVYSGCRKKEDKKPTDYSASTNNANADNAFAGVWKEISTVTDSSNALRSPSSTLSACATASITPFDLITWPKTVIIDFGTTNCTGSDGNNRRGKITAVFSGRYLDSNTVITVTLTNYYHNDYHIEGTQIITNKGRNSAGHRVFNVVVNNAIVTNPTNGKQTTWNTNQNREFFAGYNTWFNIFDDVYKITGSAHGVAENGESYTLTINTPLQINVGCPWIVSGVLTIALADYPTYPIVCDYGTGTCDATGTATLAGTTYTIYMN